jgi:hypothetical protein
MSASRSSKDDKSSSALTKIILALIGIIPTIALAYIGYLQVIVPMEKAASITQTAEERDWVRLQTEEAKAASKTAAATQTQEAIPATATSEPSEPDDQDTPSDADPSPTSIMPADWQPGDDWVASCIQGQLWEVYKARAEQFGNGCWDLVNWGIQAEGGALIVQQDETRDGNVIGVHTPILSPAEISFTVQVDVLEASSGQTAALLFGLLPVKQVDVRKGTFLLLFESGGSINIAIQEKGNEPELWKIEDIGEKIYAIRLLVEDEYLNIYVDDNEVAGGLSLPATDNTFMVGYSLSAGDRAYASVFDLEIR